MEKEIVMVEETLEQYIERNTKGIIEPGVRALAQSYLRYGAQWQAERNYDDAQLYSEIENLIITWNIDGTLTAGALTRQIIEHIKKK